MWEALEHFITTAASATTAVAIVMAMKEYRASLDSDMRRHANMMADQWASEQRLNNQLRHDVAMMTGESEEFVNKYATAMQDFIDKQKGNPTVRESHGWFTRLWRRLWFVKPE